MGRLTHDGPFPPPPMISCAHPVLCVGQHVSVITSRQLEVCDCGVTSCLGVVVTVFALCVRLSQGEYLGKTVQVVPHITNAIGDWIERGDVHDPVCGWTDGSCGENDEE